MKESVESSKSWTALQVVRFHEVFYRCFLPPRIQPHTATAFAYPQCPGPGVNCTNIKLSYRPEIKLPHERNLQETCLPSNNPENTSNVLNKLAGVISYPDFRCQLRAHIHTVLARFLIYSFVLCLPSQCVRISSCFQLTDREHILFRFYNYDLSRFCARQHTWESDIIFFSPTRLPLHTRSVGAKAVRAVTESLYELTALVPSVLPSSASMQGFPSRLTFVPRVVRA
jgi:hypothetical protein